MTAAQPTRLPDIVVESPVLTLQQAGAYLQRGRSWMLKYADEIGCIREPKRISFRPENLAAWLARHERAPRGAGGPAPTMIHRPALKHATDTNPLDNKKW